MFQEVWKASDSSCERFMANSPPIDELSREELIVIVRERQERSAALSKLIGQLRRRKAARVIADRL